MADGMFWTKSCLISWFKDQTSTNKRLPIFTLGFKKKISLPNSVYKYGFKTKHLWRMVSIKPWGCATFVRVFCFKYRVTDKVSTNKTDFCLFIFVFRKLDFSLVILSKSIKRFILFNCVWHLPLIFFVSFAYFQSISFPTIFSNFWYFRSCLARLTVELQKNCVLLFNKMQVLQIHYMNWCTLSEQLKLTFNCI